MTRGRRKGYNGTPAQIIAARAVPDPVTGCHFWPGAKSRNGYGFIRNPERRGSKLLTHRVAYEAAKGKIPDGLQIDHLCRNRACCNPDHLEAVTGRVNTLRGNTIAAMNACKTHCKRGHPLTAENVRVRPSDGGRTCLVCERLRLAASVTGAGRGGNNRAKTHCPAGHPYSGEHLGFLGNGGRYCLTCRRERDRSRSRATNNSREALKDPG